MSSSPALRSLQISIDGKTLVGRSPKIESKSSSPLPKKIAQAKNEKSTKKITPYFPKIDASISNEKTKNEATPLTNRIDIGVNTKLKNLHNFKNDDEEQVLELLYKTGPSKTFWKKRADQLRSEYEKAVLEKLACLDEIENLVDEKRRLEIELEDFKEYFELRQYSDNSSNDDDT